MWVQRDPESGQVWERIADDQMRDLIVEVRKGQRPDVSDVVERSDTRVVLAVRWPGGASGGTVTYVHENDTDGQLPGGV